ncbi:TPA: cysteine desulfurase [Candidatus Woesearchaeota archaeon]|nr:cysteine desulfurase [Candidatus Woesearchaeota archaeon]HIH12840.1 cysteine desulfurase [Candidatus Woesearchaeota archaeon]
MKPIYLDHAASTPVDPWVLKAMLPFFTTKYGNPRSVHAMGREAHDVVEDARKRIAGILHAAPEEIIFTSGGTESVSLAIKGVAMAKGRGHLITSSIEHPAVLETCKYLETKGFSVTYIPVDRYGLVSAKAVEKAIRRDTILITIMYANNEIGTIEPIAALGRLTRARGILFHTDACQAGSLELDVRKLKVDLLTLNGSKIHAPKGVGVLYRKLGVELIPLFHGGGQEFGVRGGTVNVPGIVGMAKALELVQKNKDKENARLRQLGDYFIGKILKSIPRTTLNGHPTQRLPNNVHISFAGVDAEALLHHLSAQGIYVSMGSACSAQEIQMSPVLKAIRLPKAKGLSSLRFSLGKETRKEELEKVVKVLQMVVESLRKVAR